MTSKGLSNSTLSLRFMQNAQRAKQLKEVELDRAEVQDDGKWEVSQAVRDSWGISRDTQSESSDVHEASYLPFIFSTRDEDTSESDNVDIRKTTGRRIFNKQGQEVTMETNLSATTPAISAPPSEYKGRKVHPRPISISATGSSGQLRDFERIEKPKSKRKDDSKTARQAIFENGGVGTDLRTQARSDDVPPKSTTFLKPAGIDVPKDLQTAPAALTSNSDNVINGARSGKKKRERERDTIVGEPGDVSANPKKRKKKKNSE
ncbi:hypothetical protein CPB84DRAFT_1747567 [Gymnopilus junonius]|uniref:Uncharacterized protein n=1 Tax=Gymnopilus junonius TaxID=109634 RepID=A0A9P5TLV4_GYMJU|nr:hypothetical protein CPB84DRAFT_1747567 [Gymnopilus junonius]